MGFRMFSDPEIDWMVLGAIFLGFLITYVVHVYFKNHPDRGNGREHSPLDKDFFNHELQVRQEGFITTYEFSPGISKKIQDIYPHLSSQDVPLVLTGLREFFLLCHLAGFKTVSLPSQVVDVGWHEFILSTRDYEKFCQASFGRFLHHTPAEAMEGTTQASEGIDADLMCFLI